MTTPHAGTREQSAEKCVHHWMVEPAGGPTSGARCRRCGAERSFFNNPDAVTDMDSRPRSGFNNAIEHRRGRGTVKRAE